jgi:hypothetical protein
VSKEEKRGVRKERGVNKRGDKRSEQIASKELIGLQKKVHFRDTKEEPKERKPILPTINLPFCLRLPPLAQSGCQLVTQLGIYQLSTSTLPDPNAPEVVLFQPHAYS